MAGLAECPGGAGVGMDRGGRRLEAAAVVVAVAVGILVGAATAFASHWQGPKAGGSNVRFDSCELSNNSHDALHSNDSHDIEPTDITSSIYHSCDTVDVRINDWPFGTDDPYGWYECHQYHSADNCDHGHAHINTSYDFIPEDYDRTLSLVCHEIGHSVGLGHAGQDGSCMVAVGWPKHFTDHDGDAINSHY